LRHSPSALGSGSTNSESDTYADGEGDRVTKGWSYDKRKGKRQALGHRAAIVRVEDGKPIAGCMVVDLSQTGARLQLKDSAEVPKEFVLLMSNISKVLRRCEVVWRREQDIGVRFVAGARKK
jgi:hypothetical protein